MANPPKIPPWLVLLMVILVLSLGSAGSAFQRMDNDFRPFRTESATVENALICFKLVTGTGICFGLYGCFVIYRREPGTLQRLKLTLIGRFVFIVAGGLCVPIIAKLPAEATNAMFTQVTWGALSSFAFTAIWITYLTRSKQVRVIYG